MALLRKNLLTICALAFGLGVTCFLAAQPPTDFGRSIYPDQAMVRPTELLRCCCDNYCRKTLPCITDFCAVRLPDNYCSKPCPCVPCYDAPCASECYCRKQCPDLCRPLAADYFSCATCSAGCAEPVSTNGYLSLSGTRFLSTSDNSQAANAPAVSAASH
jgi:hypothetical protein